MGFTILRQTMRTLQQIVKRRRGRTRHSDSIASRPSALQARARPMPFRRNSSYGFVIKKLQGIRSVA